jgi:hypothetical protein
VVDQPVEVLAVPSDCPVDVADAVVAVQRLQKLKRLRAQAVESAVPALMFHVDKEVRQLERGLRAGGQAEAQQVNEVLRRHMDQKFQEEAERVRKRQDETRKRKNNTAKVKAAIAKAKALKAQALAEKKAVQAKFDTLPKKLLPEVVGQPGAKGLKARSDSLERLKLGSPKLHWTREARWVTVREAYAAYIPLRFRFAGGDKAMGVNFVKELIKVLKALGPQYKGPSDFKKPGMAGSVDAFSEFFKRMEDELPKRTVAAVF